MISPSVVLSFRSFFKPSCVWFVFLLFCCNLSAQTPELAAKRLDEFVRRLPDFAPGYAFTVVTKDKILVCRANGILREGSDAKLTTSTPLYVASQTKSWVGLLAASLHEKNIFRLDDKITDHWPGVKLPNADASKVRLGDLLYHTVPFEIPYIRLFEKELGPIEPSLYPFVIEKYATPARNDFKYDNIGYNIWAAVLESSTGRNWKTWLQEVVIDELDLKNTTTRHDHLDPGTLPWRHVRLSSEKSWYALPPKSDSIMNSAGGLSSSILDQAKWLQTHLTSENSKNKLLTPDVFFRAHRSGTGKRKLPRRYEYHRTGYSLGWNVFEVEGKTWHMHGGGLKGVRSFSAFSKELGIGFSFCATSDRATIWLGHRLLSQLQLYLNDSDKAEQWAERRIKDYSRRATNSDKLYVENIVNRNADPGWGEWKWKPTKEELSLFGGTYYSDPSTGQRFHAKVYLVNDQLRMKLGAIEWFLKPAKTNLFGAAEIPNGYAISTRFYQKKKGEKAYQLTWGRGSKTPFKLLRRKSVN